MARIGVNGFGTEGISREKAESLPKGRSLPIDIERAAAAAPPPPCGRNESSSRPARISGYRGTWSGLRGARLAIALLERLLEDSTIVCIARPTPPTIPPRRPQLLQDPEISSPMYARHRLVDQSGPRRRGEEMNMKLSIASMGDS